jgi:hemerythrin-like domain-containing protein
MNIHTPIRRHKALVSFSKEHHFALLLIWKIRQGLSTAVSAERICNYVLYFFREDLESHFREEEQLLFCRLPAEDPFRQQAESEHRSIRKLVAGIAEKKGDPVLLLRFANELEKHIRFEERVLFNHLQQYIDPETLEKIETRFSGSDPNAGEKWEDKFWETEK